MKHVPIIETVLGIWLPWMACGVAAAGFLLATGAGVSPVGPDHWVAWLPLAASVVLFGLPHGAVDHLEIAQLAGRRLSSPFVVVSLVAYVLAVVLAVSVWWFAPTVAFAGFIALTWLHWGQGDVWFLLHCSSSEQRSLLERILLAASRGALPMLGPLAFDPDSYRRVYSATTGLFGTPAVASATWKWASSAALVTLVALVVLYAVVRLRRGITPSLRLESFDLAALLLLFATVPGIFAVGLYFCVWHSPRHIVRLAAARGDRDDADGPAIRSTLRDSVPLTLVSIVGGLAVGLTVVSGGFEHWVGWYLVLISGLTVPHVAVVSWRDRVEGVWRA